MCKWMEGFNMIFVFQVFIIVLVQGNCAPIFLQLDEYLIFIIVLEFFNFMINFGIGEG